MQKERIVAVDIETMGLDSQADLILEVEMQVLSLDLKTVTSSISVVIWDQRYHPGRLDRLVSDAARGDMGSGFVLDMHRKNGLFAEAFEKGVSFGAAEELLVNWMKENEIQKSDPMFGSSVGFDRDFLKAWLPDVESRFHYRNIDTSSLKELCETYNPKMFAHMAGDCFASFSKTHRTADCLEDTKAEMRWYMDNFLYISEMPGADN